MTHDRSRLHLIALDAEASGAVASLPRMDQWKIENWTDLASFSDYLDANEYRERVNLVIAAPNAAALPLAELRALQVGMRRLDFLLVVRDLSIEEHRHLLEQGVGRVERLPLPPLPIGTLLRDRSFLASLFPGSVEGERRETFEFELPSRRSAVPGLIRLLCERCDALGHPNEFVRSQLPLVIDEVVTNAMQHGHEWDPTLEVRVVAVLTPDHVELVVRDRGPGFDRAGVRDPLQKENLGRVGGRGLFLMEAIMDEVEYTNGGRTVVLRKRVSVHLPVTA